jgi:hypothetical protein
MYEYKVFDTAVMPEKDAPYDINYDSRKLHSINDLLEWVTGKGWEPVSVDYIRGTVFCRRSKKLND